jgi:poly(3-hydroxybutyrate) depolymerase
MRRERRLRGIAALVAGACVVGGVTATSARAIPIADGGASHVRIWKIHYRAHDGRLRPAYVLLPSWYGPGDDPPLPLVISPHGRGVDALVNARLWGDLPELGPFAVVNPEGQGRRLELYSWGDRGQIQDLARMPDIVERALPWLNVDRRRIYAVGGSMGGQETLLLVAHHPHLLAGAAAFDAPTNMTTRYRDFALLRRGPLLQELARDEIGGPPSTNPGAYRSRSPLDMARRIAFSGVPLQLWWGRNDRVVVDEASQSGRLYRDILRLNPNAPVREFVGSWAHTKEMRADRRLPIALGLFGLLPSADAHFGAGRMQAI